MQDDILTELDRALDDLRAAREQLAALATAPRKDTLVENEAAWGRAQQALINAQEKVELARVEIRRLLAEG
jgi:hypothetical protein